MIDVHVCIYLNKKAERGKLGVGYLGCRISPLLRGEILHLARAQQEILLAIIYVYLVVCIS